MDYQALLEQIRDEVRPEIGKGRTASYIPALASVDPQRFGIAVADVDGQVCGVGDWLTPFSMQSITKVFALALVLAEDHENLWKRVGREPSGNPFNSFAQLEYEKGIPRNPFINVGALVVTDRLMRHTGDAAYAVREFLRSQSGNRDVDFDVEVAESEIEHGQRNAALGYVLAGFDNLEHPVRDVVTHYSRQCSIAMNCRDVAVAAGFLARHGVCANGDFLLQPSEAKRMNAIMLTCGTYDAAGEFAYRVGLPGKSGVGGGILAVIPNRCTICVWSPALDTKGNSVAGVAALDRFTSLTGWSIF